MSLIEVPQEIFTQILDYTDVESRLNLRLTCRLFLFVRNYIGTEVVNFQKDYSNYYSIREVILNIKENTKNSETLIETTFNFLKENIGKINSVGLTLDLSTIPYFEFIEKIFESSAHLVWNLKLNFVFSSNSPQDLESKFLSKFQNLKSLSLNLVNIRNTLDLILDELQTIEFEHLKIFELSIRSSTFTFNEINMNHMKRIEETILGMKKLKKVTLDLAIGSELGMELKTNPEILKNSLFNISSNCLEFNLKLESHSILGKIHLNEIKISKLEINQIPESLTVNSSLRELRFGSFSTIVPISNQILNVNFLKGNQFNNLKRLELFRVRNLKESTAEFPSLEYVYCWYCNFNSGIDFFTNIEKLKSLILTNCKFETFSKSEFKCKELEELSISTNIPIQYLDFSLLNGLKLRKLIIHLPMNADLSSIEQMISLEYLSLGQYYRNLSFEHLKNLKYLEFEYSYFNQEPTKYLLHEHLLFNCVIYMSDIQNETGMAIPILSETGTETIKEEIKSEISQKLRKQFNCEMKSVKFILLSKTFIYVSFYCLNTASLFEKKNSFPSYILFERNSPFKIVSSGRSFQAKPMFIAPPKLPPQKKPQKCEIF